MSSPSPADLSRSSKVEVEPQWAAHVGPPSAPLLEPTLYYLGRYRINFLFCVPPLSRMVRRLQCCFDQTSIARCPIKPRARSRRRLGHRNATSIRPAVPQNLSPQWREPRPSVQDQRCALCTHVRLHLRTKRKPRERRVPSLTRNAGHSSGKLTSHNGASDTVATYRESDGANKRGRIEKTLRSQNEERSDLDGTLSAELADRGVVS